MSRVVSRLALALLLGASSSVQVACDPEPIDADVDSATEADAGEHHDAGAVVDVVCTVKPPTECPDPAPRFADVAPIFKERCNSCHNSEWTGPWPLDTYSHVADWADVVRAHLIDCSMPPPEAGMPLPDEESLKILSWIRCGTPR